MALGPYQHATMMLVPYSIVGMYGTKYITDAYVQLSLVCKLCSVDNKYS